MDIFKIRIFGIIVLLALVAATGSNASEANDDMRIHYFKERAKNSKLGLTERTEAYDTILSMIKPIEAGKYVYGKGVLLTSYMRHAEALRILQEGLKSVPEDSLKYKLAILSLMAYDQFQEGDLQGAMHSIMQVRSRKKPPRQKIYDIQVSCVMFDIFLNSTNDTVRMKKIYDEMVFLLEELKKSDASRSTIDHAVDLIAKSRVNLLIAGGRYDRALAELKKEEDIAKKNPYSYLGYQGHIAQIYEMNGMPAQAEEYYRKILASNLTSIYVAITVSRYGTMLVNAGRWPEAKRLYDSHPEVEERLGGTLEGYVINHNRYLIERNIGNPDSAMRYLEKSFVVMDSIIGEQTSSYVEGLGLLYDNWNEMRRYEQTESNMQLTIAACALLGLCVMALGIAYFKERKRRHACQTTVACLNASIKEAERQARIVAEKQNSSLSLMALRMARQNEAIESLNADFRNGRNSIKDIREKLSGFLKENAKTGDMYESYRRYFQEAYHDFLERLHFVCPSLTKAESRMAVFIRMNMSAKEVAELTSRSVHTVNCIKYSLKKKLCPAGSLEDYLNSLTNASQSDLESMRLASEKAAQNLD